jgi:hypothetical protein
MLPGVGEPEITNADLVSWTCSNDKDANFRALIDSTTAFFDAGYGNDWNMKIEYSDAKIDSKSFGHKNYLRNGIYDLIAAATASSPAMLPTHIALTYYRERGFASQIIPCLSGGIAQVSLKSQAEYFHIQSFKDTQFK